VGVNALLALLLFALDASYYEAQRLLAERLARECGRSDPSVTVWYFGNGAFEFYGNRLGFKTLLNGKPHVSSGDRVLVVKGFEQYFADHAIASHCDLELKLPWYSLLPVKSQYQFGSVAVARHDLALTAVSVYRVR
jgi:hypothetical protein